MNRFERTAHKIAGRHGVHVCWVSATREYLIERSGFTSSARKADSMAREVARRANAYGVLGGLK